MPAAPDPTVFPLDHLALKGQPEAPALVFKTHVLSYEALNRRLGQLAAWLAVKVPEPGARVATWLPKSELACLMPLAAVRAGLVHVPVNPLLKRAQVAHILSDSGARLLISNAGRLATLEEGDLAEAVSREEGAVWAEAERLEPLGPSNAASDELAAILYTSGSTGGPRA